MQTLVHLHDPATMSGCMLMLTPLQACQRSIDGSLTFGIMHKTSVAVYDIKVVRTYCFTTAWPGWLATLYMEFMHWLLVSWQVQKCSKSLP